MTTDELRTLQAAIRDGIRDGFEPVVQQLEAIRQALMGEMAAAAATSCPHPEDQRVDLTAAQGPREFVCQACREHVIEPVPAEATV